MKNNLLSTILAVLLLCLSGTAQAQSVVISDTGGCFGGFELTFAGTFNGKNYYNNTGRALCLYWDSGDSRWEVDGSNATPGTNTFLVWVNPADSSPNPPDNTLGTWTDVSTFCGTLTQLNGSGTQSGLLPVELISFQGLPTAKSIQLSWETSLELNNEKFEIESSASGQAFQKIGEVSGHGTSSQQHDYSFTIDDPQPGVFYYRLKQIDFDGQFEYSEVISVNFTGVGDEVVRLFPNPSNSGVVNVTYESPNDGEIAIAVTDLAGKLLANQAKPVRSGTNNLRLEFSNLGTGVYLIRIGEGAQAVTRKLMISRAQ